MSITNYSLPHFSDRLLSPHGDQRAESTVQFIYCTTLLITFFPLTFSSQRASSWKLSVLSLSALPIYASLSLCCNDKPASSPHSVIELHLVLFFSSLTAEFPRSQTWRRRAENFIYSIKLLSLDDIWSTERRVCVTRVCEREKRCYRSIVCWQPEQDVCACTGRGVCV